MPASEHRGPALVALSLGFGVVQLDVTAVTTALRAMQDGLGGSVGVALFGSFLSEGLTAGLRLSALVGAGCAAACVVLAVRLRTA